MVKFTLGMVGLLFVFYDTSIGFAVGRKIDSNADIRITGGSTAAEGQFPYQVSLRSRRNLQHSCGGSIINSKWILTAAHCVFRTSASSWFIAAGSVTLRNAVSRRLSNIIVHENFTGDLSFDDIAVLELESELQFTENIQAIQIETEDVGEVNCVVAGWGSFVNQGRPQDILQYLNVTTLTTEQCFQSWGQFFADDRQTCASAQVGQGICSGDSGGPLVANGKQIGVAVSVWDSCATGYPDMYTKVSAYIDWIEKSIN